MDTVSISRKLRLSAWAKNIHDQQNSGLKIKDWCSQNGKSLEQFYYWKRKLKEVCLESALPDIVPINLPVSNEDLQTGATLTNPSNSSIPEEHIFTSCTTSSILLHIDLRFLVTD